MPERVERKAFGEGLRLLNVNMGRMASEAQVAVRKATDSLVTRNAAQAREVFVLDGAIYRLQQDIERECTDLIALHAPVARDLRTITTVLKISTDIDRIGRGARNIAEMAIEIAALPPTKPKKLDKISRSADLATHMVDQAVRAFVEQNDQGVREMGRFDDAVDALYREIFDDLVAGMKDRSLSPEVGARLLLANRHIERIADHAVNIADRIVYLVSGEAPYRTLSGHDASTSPQPPSGEEGPGPATPAPPAVVKKADGAPAPPPPPSG